MLLLEKARGTSSRQLNLARRNYRLTCQGQRATKVGSSQGGPLVAKCPLWMGTALV